MSTTDSNEDGPDGTTPPEALRDDGADGAASNGAANNGSPSGGAGRARMLFRYVTVEEWADYRQIIAVFADTFFAEFTPEDVTSTLAERGHLLDPQIVTDRLERLRIWGNLTVSSSVGNPNSLQDYYKRRNRYLITRAGQEVHAVVEGVLSRIDEVRDVSTSRLRSLRDALETLLGIDPMTADPGSLADAVRAVFDPHEAFTSEISQFFAAINQWQARYDLSAEEFRFFAEVLVGYVGDRLDEIQRTSRPISRLLTALEPRIPEIVERMTDDLAGRIDRAGLSGSVTATRHSGTDAEHWEHLAAWFCSTAARPSRIDRLARDAVAAIRTLTVNLTRLSRIGIGASSRRGDYLRLATFFDSATDTRESHLISAAAFGLFAPVHLGRDGGDTADPVQVSTSWWTAPKAPVEISLRERGETTNRGATTPLRDRRWEKRRIRERRDRAAAERAAVDDELLSHGDLTDAHLSTHALVRLEGLLSRTTHRRSEPDGTRRLTDQRVTCIVRPAPAPTILTSPQGVLTLENIAVSIEATS